MRALRCGRAIFVAGAANREVVSCGRGECRCDVGIGACTVCGCCLEGLESRNCLAGCVMCVCHPWSHRDAFAFVLFYSRGCQGPCKSGTNKDACTGL